MKVPLTKLMSDYQIHLHLDRSYKQTIPDHLKSEIAFQGGDVDPDKARIAFCGFIFKGKDTYVFMPRGSTLKQDGLGDIEMARLLFQCLTKYCRANESFLQKDGRSTVVGNPQILPLIVEILNDYKVNGIYTSENSFNRKGFQGKTDWKKTIGTVDPHVDDDEIIYPHFINKFTNSYYSNEVTKIHYSILEAIQERFGWLLSDTQKISFNTSKRIGNRSADVGLIKAELRGVFNDAKIHTLKNLIQFLEDDFNTGNNESVSYGFSDFQYVWEHMLRNVLSPTHAFSDMPIPAYLESSGREIKVGQKGQRVDIFLYEPINKEACVIDAKYYDGSSVDRAPGWPDLVKQFFYAKSLTAGNLKHEVSSVKNYFIFPGLSRDSSPEMAYVTDSTGRLDSEFPPIKCLHVSPELIITSYVSSKPFLSLRQKLFN
jgi:hypothetical protein